MALVYDFARNSTHFTFWLGKRDKDHGVVTLWLHVQKACWCLEHPDRGLPRICQIIPPLEILQEVFPFTTHRYAQAYHLLSDGNLSRYPDIRYDLFCAAAPLFLILLWNGLENGHARVFREQGRHFPRVFQTMMYEIFLLYLGKQLINMVLAVHWASQVPSYHEDDWLFRMIDFMLDSAAMDTWFASMVIVIGWVVDCMLHRETPAQNLHFYWLVLCIILQNKYSVTLSDSPILMWH